MPNIINAQERVDLVDGQTCLEELFPNRRSRPSLRWFQNLRYDGLIPCRKIGRRVFFDVNEVRRALDKQCRR